MSIAPMLRHDGAMATWKLATIRDASTRKTATNVLLSRRSYAQYHVLLMMNMDEYAKKVQVRVPGLEGSWVVTEGISKEPLVPSPDRRVWRARDLRDRGTEVTLAAGGPAVLIIDREQ